MKKCITVITLLILSATTIQAEEVSFKRDVLPVFMRYGCNAGDCHGSARGKDGFMLSLFGYDPEGDYYRLMEEIPGRRVNIASPEKSLLLEKALGAVTHTGGELFGKEDEAYSLIRKWIAEGAKPDPVSTPTTTGIRMEPKTIDFSKAKQSRPGKVIATYSDGSERDVTRWSLFLSSNEGVVSIDKDGKVLANRPGGAHVFARFSRFTEGSEVTVLPEGDFKWSPPKPTNYIDDLVYAKLKKLRIHPSKLSSDEHFVRRVTIDLTGTLPTPDEFTAFVNSEDPEKRKKLIDELIARDDFGELWAAKWGEWLRIDTSTNPGNGTAVKAGWTYFYWLRDQFINDRSLGNILEELINGTGSNLRHPTSNFYTMLPQGNIDAGILGKDVAQVTLGIRTGCAECHNHPFDRWTMDDYYSWTSFFTGIQRKRGREAREMLVSVNVDAAPAKHLLHKEPMPHRFLGGEAPDVTDKDPRKVLAKWMTSKDNTLFRRNMANRIWANFFNRGIVDPIDDIRISNPPSNEPLLEELGRRLSEDYDYSLRKLVRDICNSTTYQLSAETIPANKSDEEFFSHAVLRRPRADVLFDMLNQAMEYTPPIRRTMKTKAVDLFEGGKLDNHNSYFFSTFGQAARKSVCACETSNDANLAQSLHMINGTTIERAMTRNPVLIPRLVNEHKEYPETIIEKVYIRALSRKPTPTELELLLKEKPDTKHNKELAKYYHNILWGVLNSSEFLFNH